MDRVDSDATSITYSDIVLGLSELGIQYWSKLKLTYRRGGNDIEGSVLKTDSKFMKAITAKRNFQY